MLTKCSFVLGVFFFFLSTVSTHEDMPAGKISNICISNLYFNLLLNFSEYEVMHHVVTSEDKSTLTST